MRNGKGLGIRVQLADNEWDSSFKAGLRSVADELFELMPDLDMVEVNEHAGWWLHFGRLPDSQRDDIVGVVDTANDAAALTNFRRSFWQRFHNVEWEYLPTIYRGNVQNLSNVQAQTGV